MQPGKPIILSIRNKTLAEEHGKSVHGEPTVPGCQQIDCASTAPIGTTAATSASRGPHVPVLTAAHGTRASIAFTNTAEQKISSLGWARGRKLGSGAYGSVHAALDRATGQLFAVKDVALEDTAADGRYGETLEKELAILRNLRHPNIVGYLGHDRTESGLHIHLEYMPGGSMASLLREFGRLEVNQLQSASRDVLAGVCYLHKQKPPVVHRDVKAANLLVNCTFHVKLSDFGLSKQSTNTTSVTVAGSIPWMAPEVIQQQDGHGRKADIWSFGCTVIEMATAETPWGPGVFDNAMFALMHIGMSEATPPIPNELPQSCQDLIRCCVRRDPGERPSAREARQHEFIVRQNANIRRA